MQKLKTGNRDSCKNTTNQYTLTVSYGKVKKQYMLTELTVETNNRRNRNLLNQLPWA